MGAKGRADGKMGSLVAWWGKKSIQKIMIRFKSSNDAFTILNELISQL